MSEFLIENKLTEELVTIGYNLTTLMLKKNVETKTVSALTGISVSLLNSLKRGEGNPTLGTLITIAKYFGISIDDLMSAKQAAHQEAVKVIPVYLLRDTHAINMIKSQQNIYLQIANSSDGLFAVTINNSSMLPFFDKGSTFIISVEKKYIDGDIVLMRINNERNIFRKVFLINNGHLFQHISVDAESHIYDHYQIIGTVTKVIHDLGNANE